MIDLDSIKVVDTIDGEELYAFGRDADTGERRWGWIPLDLFREAGRQDIVEAFGLDAGYARAA